MMEPLEVKRYQRELRAMISKASEDPESLAIVSELIDSARILIDREVHLLRDQGYSDADIGRALGVTRQAVQQRYPRRRP